MQIYLYQSSGKKDGTRNRETHRIVEYTKLTSNTSALLVFESEPLPDLPYYEIRPIQFIAACETDQHIQFIGAFYIGEYADLVCQVISDVPNYYREREAYVIDYKSYTEICKLTGEETLSFVEYVKVQRKAYDCDLTNSFIVSDGQWLNASQQAELPA